MKKGLFLLPLFAAMSSMGQNAVLKKGQAITVVTTTKQSIDMMVMQMKNTSGNTTLVTVTDVNDKDYKVSSTTTRITMDGEMMGQTIAYDSDKKEDRASETGKQFEDMLGKTDMVLIDIKTGNGRPLSPEKIEDSKSDDALQGMISGAAAGNSTMTASSIFFKPSVEIKAGATWTDSSTENGMKSINIYKIDKISGDLATILVNGTVDGSTTMDMQGQSFEMKMKTKMTGTLVINTKTFLTTKRTNVADTEGTMAVMGQEMPFTSNTTIESTYK